MNEITEVENPRAVLGGNAPPDHGKMAAERMDEEYGGLASTVDALLAEAREAPKEVTDDATMGVLAKLVKRLRDAAAQCTAYHKREKEPYLRAGQAVDRFFFGLHERCARRQKGDKPGAADVLQARVDDYMQRKLAEEQRRRDEAARIARQAEEEATRRRLAEEAAARERDAQAQRARKPENVETHKAAATQHAANASDARIDEEVVREAAKEASIAAAAKPADMVGTRVSDDVKVTMSRENYAEVTDVSKLDPGALWAFVEDDAKAKALKAWAKVTQYKRPMEGAAIGSRPKTVIR